MFVLWFLTTTALALPDCAELVRAHQPAVAVDLDAPLTLRPPRPELPAVGTARTAAQGWLTVYQRAISPADGPSCTFFPVCSGYARQAFARNGPFVGLVMALNRIGRPHGGPEYIRCESGGRRYWFDPVWDHEPRRSR